MEIITGVERRRRWRDEEKLRILSELDEPVARFADVARRHEVSRGLLWQWRDARRRGKLTSERPSFVPVRGVRELPAPELQGAAGPTPPSAARDPDDAPDDRIEIVLPDGTAVRVTAEVSATALRRVRPNWPRFGMPFSNGAPDAQRNIVLLRTLPALLALSG